MKKFNVFLIKKTYEEERREVQIMKQWTETIGEERVLKIENPKACIDVMLGAISISSGNRSLDTYLEDMKVRGQTSKRIEEVAKALKSYSVKISDYKSKKDDLLNSNKIYNNNLIKNSISKLDENSSVSLNELIPNLKIEPENESQKEPEIDETKLRSDLIAMKNIFRNEIPEHLLCPITSEIFIDPVMTCDGHTYERAAIEKWLERHHTSPQTNLNLDNKSLISNFVIKQLVKAFYEENLDKLKK
jgi:hypothetical protein